MSETDKNVAIDGDLYAYIAERAKKDHRTIKGQIAYMVDLARSMQDADGTQINLPIDAADRAEMFGRIQ